MEKTYTDVINYYDNPLLLQEDYFYTKSRKSGFGNKTIYWDNSDNIFFYFWIDENKWIAYQTVKDIGTFEIGCLTKEGIKIAKEVLLQRSKLTV